LIFRKRERIGKKPESLVPCASARAGAVSIPALEFITYTDKLNLEVKHPETGAFVYVAQSELIQDNGCIPSVSPNRAGSCTLPSIRASSNSSHCTIRGFRGRGHLAPVPAPGICGRRFFSFSIGKGEQAEEGSRAEKMTADPQ